MEWTEQAQIGHTHLVIISPTYGVIIMKAPQDVHSFGVDFTSPEYVPVQVNGSIPDQLLFGGRVI